jgi:hypothetical protein
MHKHLTVLGMLIAMTLSAIAGDIVSPWSRERAKPDNSQGAVVSQIVGADTWVQIAYHRPGLKGRDVWHDDNSRGNAIVPHDAEPYPWRAGANEPTTIEVSGSVKIEGQELAAGKYAFYIIPRNDAPWTLVFQSWADQGSVADYDTALDTLRVDVSPIEAPSNEWMMFGFDDAEAWSTLAYLHWGTVKLPFRIEVDSPSQG